MHELAWSEHDLKLIVYIMLNSIMNSDFTFSDAEQKKENERTQVGITFVYVTRLAKKVTPKFKGKLDVMDKENNNSLNDEAAVGDLKH